MSALNVFEASIQQLQEALCDMYGDTSSSEVEVEVRIDDKRVPSEHTTVMRIPGPNTARPGNASFVVTAQHTVPRPPAKIPEPIAPIALQSHMIVITARARGESNAAAGWLSLVGPAACAR